jgi:MFS family permease
MLGMASRLRVLRALATDLTPLRADRDYRLLWSGNLISTIGRQITVVAVPYQVFLLTHSSLAVGAIGIVQLIPLVVLSLAGGAIADQVDRRRLLLTTNTLLAGCSTVLTVGAFLHWHTVAHLYATAALIAAFSAVDQPTRAATVPNLVPREHLASALALNFAAFQTSLLFGPALGGLIIATVGIGPGYLVDVLTFGAAIAAVAAIPPQPPRGAQREPVLRSIRAGLGFVVHQRVLLGSFAADLVAMVFGMRRALYPVLATSVFKSGAVGLGLLSSAPAVGAVIASFTSGWVGRTRAQGRVVIAVVALWGLTVIWLGLAGSLWLAMLALAVGGAADAFSAVSRNTIMQTITPDHMRGRMSAIYTMVVVGGPSLGDLEAGGVATAFSPAVSIVSGGVLCLAGLGAVTATMPQLLRYRARWFTEPEEAAAAQAAERREDPAV